MIVEYRCTNGHYTWPVAVRIIPRSNGRLDARPMPCPSCGATSRWVRS